MRPVPALLALLIAVPACLAAEPDRRTWELSPFTWVKRRPAERGAPANAHPVRVDAAALGQALADLRLLARGRTAPLFTPEEARALAAPLAEALALAGPGEDLELMSSAKRDGILLDRSTGVVARAFVAGDRLNLLVGEARLDFTDQYFAEFRLPALNHGTRAAAGRVALGGAELRRPDWALLPLAAAAVAVAKAPAPAPVVAPAPAANPAPVAAPATAVAPVAAPAPARPAATSDPDLEAKLKALKRLREQDLITEAEYARKKEELLKGL